MDIEPDGEYTGYGRASSTIKLVDLVRDTTYGTVTGHRGKADGRSKGGDVEQYIE